MERGCRVRVGGIVALCGWIISHRAAVEYDLLRHGCPLREFGPGGRPWRDAFVILSEQDRKGSSLFRAQNPKHWEWLEGLDSMLLAELVDLARLDLWRNSDEKKRGSKPDPIPRPGVEKSGSSTTSKIGESAGVSRAEFERRLKARGSR